MTIFGNISRLWNQKVQVYPMKQAFQSKYMFEDPLPSSHWGESTEVHTLQLLSLKGASLKKHIIRPTVEKPRHCIVSNASLPQHYNNEVI